MGTSELPGEIGILYVNAGSLRPLLRTIELHSSTLAGAPSLVSALAYCQTVFQAICGRRSVNIDDAQVEGAIPLAKQLLAAVEARLEAHIISSQSAAQSAARAVRDASLRKAEDAAMAGMHSRYAALNVPSLTFAQRAAETQYCHGCC